MSSGEAATLTGPFITSVITPTSHAGSWHCKPLEQARGRAESREGDRIFVHTVYLVERKNEITERQGIFPTANAVYDRGSTFP